MGIVILVFDDPILARELAVDGMAWVLNGDLGLSQQIGSA